MEKVNEELLYEEEVRNDIKKEGAKVVFASYMKSILLGCKMQVPQITYDIEETFRGLFTQEFSGYSRLLSKIDTLISIAGADVIITEIVDMFFSVPNYCLVRAAVKCLGYLDDEKSNDKLLELLETADMEIVTHVIQALNKRQKQNVRSIEKIKKIYAKRFSVNKSWGESGFIEYSSCKMDIEIFISNLEEQQ